MKTWLAAFLVMVFVVSVTGCSKTTPVVTSTTFSSPASTTQAGNQSSEFTLVKSERSRLAAPLVASQLEELAKGNSQFATDLYRFLSLKDQNNLFFSPYSISTALAMTYAGARSSTEQEVAATLHYLLAQDALHTAFNSLDQELARRGEEAKKKDGQGFRLNTVNAIWGQKNYRFESDFLDILAENYDAGLRLLDFFNAPEESRLVINKWVSDQTEDRIQDLIRPGVISSITRLVLTNAIYFNAAWLNPFEKSSTVDDVFNLTDGSEISVSFMRQTKDLGYAEGPGYQAVELMYEGRQLSMVIILPAAGEMAGLESNLDNLVLQDMFDSLQTENVFLQMPLFKFTSDFSLKDALENLGMPLAFSNQADFSGMTGNTELYIKDVVHKAFVSVDEAGTEAAAATAVIMDQKGISVDPQRVVLDRPFIFLIRDIPTGSILFLGRVMNPSF